MRKRTLTLLLLLEGAISSAQGIFPPDLQHVCPPQVPQYLIFAGDTICFDTQEKYERMDRELITFTYMHTLSTLMYRRSERVFSQIVPILRRNGIPEDFKYLMSIESSFDPKACSPAGATGLWQFTKSTATEFGLEVNTEIDQRYDTELATEAACRYLLDAYRQYGDWKLVAASYNCGRNGLNRRIEQQKQKSFFNLWLPEETSRYLYRILAAKMFLTNPTAFGYVTKTTDRYPCIKASSYVNVSGPVPSLVDFAAEHGVSYADLKKANLWLRDSKITNKSGRTYRIALP